jgi:hypothetical protein
LVYCSRDRRNRHLAHGGFAHKQKHRKAQTAPVAPANHKSGQGAETQSLQGLLLDRFFKGPQTSRYSFGFSFFLHISAPNPLDRIHHLETWSGSRPAL